MKYIIFILGFGDETKKWRWNQEEIDEDGEGVLFTCFIGDDSCERDLD